MVEVVNSQRRVSIDRTRWQEFTDRVLKELDKADENVTIAFVSDRRMRELNREFRGLDRATDVLSFPATSDAFSEVSLGDVVISTETALRQAKENALTLEREVAQLILHGVLHLCGFDHETDTGEMNRLELKLRRRLKT